MYVNKAQTVPPFTFFGTVRHFLKEKNNKKFQVFFKKSLLRILSVKYSADFRRSRLVLGDLKWNHLIEKACLKPD